MQPGTSAVDRWRSMVLAHQAQNHRLRDPDWQPPRDFAPPSVESFRSDRGRADDASVLEALRKLVPAGGTVVDIGAGAGRFAIPLARVAGHVVAVEPSESMRTMLLADAARTGVSSISIVPTRWEETTSVSGDLVFAAHVVYAMVEIEPLIRAMNAHARRSAALVVFEKPPLSWLSGFWPRVHGEERLSPPHLPQVVDVVTELGFGPPSVDLIDVEPFELGLWDVAHQKLRRRLYVAPGTPADQRLADAMRALLVERDGVLVPRTEAPIRVGLVRWAPSAAHR